MNFSREFFGAALSEADPARPVLIIGAGWGLEIPWRSAPRNTFGWDADPLSRLGTLLRHRRWVPWVFDDLTGAFASLYKVSRRVQVIEGLGKLRPAQVAAKRLAWLLPSIPPSPQALERWVHDYRPGTIICANVLGQIKPMACRIVEAAFGHRSPWINDQDLADPLHDAINVWTAGILRSILQVLRSSNSSLFLLHDRGVVHQEADIALGEWTDSWAEQVKSNNSYLEASDPLSGLDILEEFNKLTCKSKSRWIWPLGTSQIHIIEALAFKP
ncbi:MAG: hypothetical protein FWG12_07535 [Holophagaceae bacterium]|nr:hypothetical protein [Holophagaceae bacterium]